MYLNSQSKSASIKVTANTAQGINVISQSDIDQALPISLVNKDQYKDFELYIGEKRQLMIVLEPCTGSPALYISKDSLHPRPDNADFTVLPIGGRFLIFYFFFKLNIYRYF